MTHRVLTTHLSRVPAGFISVGVVVNKEPYTRRAGSQFDNVMGGTSLEGVANGIRDTIVFQALSAYLGYFRKTPQSIPPNISSSTRRYLDTLELAPGLKKPLGDGRLVDHPPGSGDQSRSSVRTASDYSYSAESYGGDGLWVIGDAGGGWS